MLPSAEFDICTLVFTGSVLVDVTGCPFDICSAIDAASNVDSWMICPPGAVIPRGIWPEEAPMLMPLPMLFSNDTGTVIISLLPDELLVDFAVKYNQFTL